MGVICLLCLATAAVAAAGCGGGAGSTPSRADGVATNSHPNRRELTGVAGGPEPTGGIVGVLRVGKVGPLGSVVIGRGFHTVYVFDGDSGSTSSCAEACAEEWPPMITQARPVARAGINASKLRATEREDGSMQVTYGGHPLYDYIGDRAAAEANGNGLQGFGGRWHAIRPGGAELGNPKEGAGGIVFGAKGFEVGQILYDFAGHTLYTFDKDEGTTPTCYGACARAWPPALTEADARAGGEASPDKIGTTERQDGTIQLTYASHPLYTHTGEEAIEVTSGGIEAFGGRWSAIRPNGRRP